MRSILSLNPNMRTFLLICNMIICSILLFCIVYNRRSKIYNAYILSIFVTLIIFILTRTPLTANQNELFATIINYIVLLPMLLTIFVYMERKDIIYFFDSLWFMFNMPLFEFLPHFKYIVSLSELYMILRCYFILLDTLENSKKYPGRLSIKQVLDSLPDGMLFVNKYGQISYINNSMKDFFAEIKLSSYKKSKEITEQLREMATKSGRIVSEQTFVIDIKDKSYKITFDNPLTQIYCIDVTAEEKLVKKFERNKILFKKANNELNENLKKIDKIQEQQELISIKGHIHDNLAQQLSILHMFILQDNSTDLSQIKNMLLSLKVTPENVDFEMDTISSLKTLLNMIGVNLTIQGQIPKDKILNKFLNKVIKEMSTNAIKHGKADKIYVNISIQGDILEIIISNNGKLPDKVVYGNGLESILSDIKKFGGEMTISIEKEFKVCITLPLIDFKF